MQLEGDFGKQTEWLTCDAYTPDTCLLDTFDKRYLSCYVSMWSNCESREECESSGSCSDREWTVVVRREEGRIEEQRGACFNSGYGLFFLPEQIPWCLYEDEYIPIGCRNVELFHTAEECLVHRVAGERRVWQKWVTPAVSEEECEGQVAGRRGCDMIDIRDSLWWMDDEVCRCRDGQPRDAFEWTRGVWRGGQPRAPNWQRRNGGGSRYVWQDGVLSFLAIEEWVLQAVEYYYTFASKSTSLCYFSFLNTPLSTLVCDCLAEDGAKNASCYRQWDSEEGLSTPVAVQVVCRIVHTKSYPLNLNG